MIEYLLVIAILSTAMFYLGSRAMITRWLWDRYPPRFAAFMDCPACVGFWWGVIFGCRTGPKYIADIFVGLQMTPTTLAIMTPIFIGLCMLTLTPIVAGIMQAGFDRLGTIAASDGEQT